MFSAIITFVGFVLMVGAVYDSRWLWQFRSVGTWLDARMSHIAARLLVGGFGGLLIYWQVRQAVDSFTGSFIGQVAFWGGSIGLLGLAYIARKRQER